MEKHTAAIVNAVNRLQALRRRGGAGGKKNSGVDEGDGCVDEL